MQTKAELNTIRKNQAKLMAQYRVTMMRCKVRNTLMWLALSFQLRSNELRNIERFKSDSGPVALLIFAVAPFVWGTQRLFVNLTSLLLHCAAQVDDPNADRIARTHDDITRVVRLRHWAEAGKSKLDIIGAAAERLGVAHLVDAALKGPKVLTNSANDTTLVGLDEKALAVGLFMILQSSKRPLTFDEILEQLHDKPYQIPEARLRTALAVIDVMRAKCAASRDEGHTFEATYL